MWGQEGWSSAWQYGSLVSIVLIPDRKPVDLGVADVADVAAIAVYVAVRVAS